MWPFKKKQAKSALELERYKKDPLNLLIEDFVLSVIGHLPEGRDEVLRCMNLQKVFSTSASEWKEVLREKLCLSDTIEIAIFDLWIRNRLAYVDAPEGHRAFAQDFTDRYFEEDSRVDVWPEGTLAAAKDRIERFKKMPNQAPQPTPVNRRG